jgi:hypothetical protein
MVDRRRASPRPFSPPLPEGYPTLLHGIESDSCSYPKPLSFRPKITEHDESSPQVRVRLRHAFSGGCSSAIRSKISSPRLSQRSWKLSRKRPEIIRTSANPLPPQYVNGRSFPLGCTSIALIGPVCGELGFASGGLPDLPATPAIFYKYWLYGLRASVVPAVHRSKKLASLMLNCKTSARKASRASAVL